MLFLFLRIKCRLREKILLYTVLLGYLVFALLFLIFKTVLALKLNIYSLNEQEISFMYLLSLMTL